MVEKIHEWGAKAVRSGGSVCLNRISASISGASAGFFADALKSFGFGTIYGHYFDRVIPTGWKQILASSVKRYVAAISGAYNNE